MTRDSARRTCLADRMLAGVALSVGQAVCHVYVGRTQPGGHPPGWSSEPYVRLSYSYGSSQGQSLSWTLPRGFEFALTMHRIMTVTMEGIQVSSSIIRPILVAMMH